MFFFKTYQNFIMDQHAINPHIGEKAFDIELSGKGLMLNADSYLTSIKSFSRWLWKHKRTPDETLKLIVPAHRPIKRSTLSHILKQANLPLDDFLSLVK